MGRADSRIYPFKRKTRIRIISTEKKKRERKKRKKKEGNNNARMFIQVNVLFFPFGSSSYTSHVPPPPDRCSSFDEALDWKEREEEKENEKKKERKKEKKKKKERKRRKKNPSIRVEPLVETNSISFISHIKSVRHSISSKIYERKQRRSLRII